jgi:gas vesicle protein GvpO
MPDLSVSDVAGAALRRLSELTRAEPVGVISVEPVDDGWVVEIELIEDRRIPSSSDMLAIYEVDLDPDGGLVAYRRTQRYRRGSARTTEVS